MIREMSNSDGKSIQSPVKGHMHLVDSSRLQLISLIFDR